MIQTEPSGYVPDRRNRQGIGPVLILSLAVVVFFSGCGFQSRYALHSVDLQNIEDYAWMAQFAYRDDSAIRARYRYYDEWCIKEVAAVEGKYVILVDHLNRRQYLVFRGTANWTNMIDDARFLSREDQRLDIAVHRGFLRHAEAVYAHILEHGDDCLEKEYDTIVIGHSLGGAIAAIVGAYLQVDGYRVRYVVTFGQPKFTNRNGMAELAGLPLVRVVNHGDIVADVPVFDRNLSLDEQYVHLGLEMMLVDDRHLVLEFQQTVTGAKPSLIRQLFSKVNINNHMMRNYLARLDELLSVSMQPAIMIEDKGWFQAKQIRFHWTQR